MEPAFKQVAKKYENQVDVWKINADESPEVLRALKVMGIPTTIGFAQGAEIIHKTGVQSGQSLDILFDATLHQRSGVILPPAPIDVKLLWHMSQKLNQWLKRTEPRSH